MSNLSSSDFYTRLISTLVLGPIVIFFAWLGGYWFVALMGFIAIVMYWEWTIMTRRNVDIRRDALALLCIVALIIAMLLHAGVMIIGVSLFLMLAGGGLVRFFRQKWGWSVAGIGVASNLALCLIYIRTSEGLGYSGLTLLMFLCFSVWAADIFAYLVGRTIGGPKLMPKISPKKTWSGFLGGLSGAVAAGSLVALFTPMSNQMALFALIAFILALAAQIGDLLESAIKRRFNVKDASRLIPGHGGILDRVDGLTLAAFVFVAICAIGLGIDQPRP